MEGLVLAVGSVALAPRSRALDAPARGRPANSAFLSYLNSQTLIQASVVASQSSSPPVVRQR